jgi:nucleotide-binding universal stress UspA family protein
MSLTLAHVADPRCASANPSGMPMPGAEHPWLSEAAEAIGQEMLSATASRLGFERSDFEVALGVPETQLIGMATAARARMLVVGASGQGARGKRRCGSVSRLLAANAHCPVLIVPDPEGREATVNGDRPQTIVCGVEGSRNGFRAAVLAAELSGRMRAPLTLVHSYDDRAESVIDGRQLLLAVADLLRDRASSMELRSPAGDPVGSLKAAVSEFDANMVVIGGSPIEGSEQAAVERLATTLPVPLLVLPQDAEIDGRVRHLEDAVRSRTLLGRSDRNARTRRRRTQRDEHQLMAIRLAAGA